MPDPLYPVIDSSPLILLARTEALSLLAVVGRTLLVPGAVAQEVYAKGPTDLAAIALANTSWLEVLPAVRLVAEVSRWELGEGEQAVLSWAWQHPETLTILDDSEARKCAKALGIPTIGTLGIVLKAKREGILDAARPLVEKLVAQGMYLSERVIGEALALVGE